MKWGVIILLSLSGGFIAAMFTIAIGNLLYKLLSKLMPSVFGASLTDKSNDTGNKSSDTKIRVDSINYLEHLYYWLCPKHLGIFKIFQSNILNITQSRTNPSNNCKYKDTNGNIKGSLPCHKVIIKRLKR